jgi:hypothetical protein
MLTPEGCETIPFGINALLNLHFGWVVMKINVKNVFNNIFWTTIYKEL